MKAGITETRVPQRDGRLTAVGLHGGLMLVVALLAGMAGCAPRSPGDRGGMTPASAGESTSLPTLPPVPLVEGPLKPSVRYPGADALIQARDSTFLFGTVGNGNATLRINGVLVPVAPNGAYLAFLPVPPASAPRYDLVATLGADTVRVSHPVRVLAPPLVLSDTGPLVVDSSSIAPRARFWLRDDDPVRVSVRAPSNATVWVRTLDGTTIPMSPSSARTWPPLDSVRRAAIAPGSTWQADVPGRHFRIASPPILRGRDTVRGPEVFVARGTDTARLVLATRDSLAPFGLAIIGTDSLAISDTDRDVAGRSIPGGTTKWLIMRGTVLEVTGRVGNAYRMRLDPELEIWVDTGAARLLPPDVARPRRLAGNARVVPGEDWVDFVVPTGERPPYYVEPQAQSLVLTLYGTQANTENLRYLANDSTIRVIHWEQVGSDRVRYTLHLAHAPFGHLAFWDRGAFVLRVRKQPRIDRRFPLRGLRIVVDAGHPPAGATGPTGLYEAVPTLAIAKQLRAMLEERGATVIMTRTTDQPLALGDRSIASRRANGQAFVSIHLNAFGDGVNPFVSHGTGTYFYHIHSEPLARAIQQSLVRRLGLPDLGRYHESFSVTRSPYMPAVLAEGAFLMFPDQENALKTEEFQRAYARGILDGLEEYFRSLAK